MFGVDGAIVSFYEWCSDLRCTMVADAAVVFGKS